MEKRVLKFRAWDNREKEWVSVGFHIFGETTLFDMIGLYCLENKGKDEDSLERLNEIEVTQFTGLHDKSGKEIYEGDILEHEYESEYGPILHTDKVIYHGGAFYPICEKPETEFKVIGNIYQNPELL